MTVKNVPRDSSKLYKMNGFVVCPNTQSYIVNSESSKYPIGQTAAN